MVTASFADFAAEESAASMNLSEEERLLQNIISAIDESQGVLGEIQADTDNVEAALESAIRNAVGGKSSRQAGHTVVQLKEQHGIVTELRNAKSSVGTVSCVTAQVDAHLTENKLQLLVGTTSSLVLLFDIRQKLLGVCGTVADAKGEVTALDSSEDGSTFIAGYERLSIILWNARTLEPLRQLQNEVSSMPWRVSFFKPDNGKFFSLTRDQLKLFNTGKVMGKVVFRSTAVEGLGENLRLSDAATATLSDPTAPPGSDQLRFFFAVTTQSELIVGSSQFSLTGTDVKIEFRRDLRGGAAAAGQVDGAGGPGARARGRVHRGQHHGVADADRLVGAGVCGAGRRHARHRWGSAAALRWPRRDLGPRRRQWRRMRVTPRRHSNGKPRGAESPL